MSAPARRTGLGGALTRRAGLGVALTRRAGLGVALTRDKADALLLLAAAVLVLAPHAAHLPPWIAALCAATLLWRMLITVRGTRLPPPLLLLPLALAAMFGIFQTFHTLLGRDAGVAMLTLLVTFKMLEMHARRDVFVVVFLCLFLVLTNFFYSQSMLTALLMAASVIVLLSAQLSFQFAAAAPPLGRRLWLGARTFLLAAPLALLLFVGFPRIQGPLWGMPGDASSGRSGLSDSMAPGKLSNLAQSEETAFRVKFIDPAPPQPQLYWRGVVLGDFDGHTWTQVRPSARGAAVSVTVNGSPIRHQVTLEPSGQRWLFALEVPGKLPALAGNAVGITPELEMSAAAAPTERVRYDVVSYPTFSVDGGAVLPDAARWLQLPSDTNPRAMAAGAALRAWSKPASRVAAVLQQFRRQGYVYTLEPPLLPGADSVDQFLYETRAGFCEHYAGAFVFLMRAARVPARVVTGYQGGEINPVDGFLTVRQSDAHAWAEVWLAGRGWMRVDPTGEVAPERVQRSMAHAPRPKTPFGLDALGGLMGLNRASWLGQLSFRWSALNNAWNQSVLNYTPERQRAVLDELEHTWLNWRGGAVLLAIGLAWPLVRALRRHRRRDPVDALYSALCRQLAQRGLARAPDEGPNAYAQRLGAGPLPAEKTAAIARFLHLYSAATYGGRPRDATLVATLKRLLNESR